MVTTLHNARITGPVPYVSIAGERGNIPLGPCLVEQIGNRLVDIIWGARGQRSAALAVEEIEAAEDYGNLVLLD